MVVHTEYNYPAMRIESYLQSKIMPLYSSSTLNTRSAGPNDSRSSRMNNPGKGLKAYCNQRKDFNRETIMPFDSGNVTFTICKLTDKLPEDVLDSFIAKVAKSTNSVKEEPQMGWVTSRHLLDTDINENTAYVAGHLYLQLRTAVRKVPASLLTAECKIEEIALQQAELGMEVTNKVKKKIKEEVSQRLLEQMPPSLAGLPFVYDSKTNLLYVGSASPKQLDGFIDEFRKTTGIEPYPINPTTILLEDMGCSEDTIPRLNFSEKMSDAYACCGTVGQDFLTYMFYLSEAHGGLINVGEELGGEFGFGIDGPLLLVAEGKGALESVIRKGLPTQSAESQASLNVGKKLKSAKMIFGRGDDVWQGTFDADDFSFRGLKLPEGEVLDHDSYFQERMMNLDIFQRLMRKLFVEFVEKLRDKGEFEKLQKKIKTWLNERGVQYSDQ